MAASGNSGDAPGNFLREVWTDDLGPTIDRGGGDVGRALVMDDDPVARKLLCRLLETLGGEAVGVAEGRSAVLAYEGARRVGRPFDIVFLDLDAEGGMDGEETLRELRRIDAGVRAVVCSGMLARPGEAYLGLGFQAVLPKPVELGKLRALVEIVGAEGEEDGRRIS